MPPTPQALVAVTTSPGEQGRWSWWAVNLTSGLSRSAMYATLALALARARTEQT